LKNNSYVASLNLNFVKMISKMKEKSFSKEKDGRK